MSVLPRTFPSGEELLYGRLFLPRGKPAGMAVLCHGLGGDHRTMEGSARGLARRGIGALVFDLRGHGRSTGIFRGQAHLDVMAACEFLQGFLKAPMALVGHSLGAMACLQVAAQLPGLAALVLISMPSMEGPRPDNFSFLAEQNIAREYPREGPPPWLRPLRGQWSRLWMWLRGYRLRISWKACLENWSRLGLAEALQELKSCPKLFVHFAGDALAPYQGTWRLYSQAPPPKDIILVRGGFHSAPLYPCPVRRRWVSWVASVLKEGASPGNRNG
jgi:pimeloyl-ACP methyl ester carboxylesterase